MNKADIERVRAYLIKTGLNGECETVKAFERIVKDRKVE